MPYMSASIQFLVGFFPRCDCGFNVPREPILLTTGLPCLQDCRLSLIHIPLQLYPHFVQAILSLILPESYRKEDGNASEPRDPKPDEAEEDEDFFESSVATDFVNISVTPVECSIVCSKEAATRFFVPVIDKLDPSLRGEVSISTEEFIAIQVDGEGLDAGQRVLDLTSPLALARVSIFFITTYFSDYILVPAKSRSSVTKALQQRGFVFEKYSDSFVTLSHHRHSSSTSSTQSLSPPTTLADLENTTFSTLRKQNVVPMVNKTCKLILCAGRRGGGSGWRGIGGHDAALKLGLVRCLVAQPRFMSVTLTDLEPVSLLLQKDMLCMFDADADILLGSKDDVLIPIVLDLCGLPVDSTGIVCGVAGRLVGGTKGGVANGNGAVEMSYLSTARAGTVMVAEADIARAVAALNM
ncbi:hypothetical protein BZA05DRAFT_262847 [Tricharina praecox]|uniref:uncharacterized protein n=1 Tax=Tricharina praecox TaxID=43433 RepID=UPI00221F811D|nr:uncharacterized protein BZA05DRAFT_262847 [Tricharina praecox]KAI5854319.1 hypothetical protein BZA05DRAFT_262847 [Tricharina praecox]